MLDDDRDPRIDDLPVDADTHNDVDLERAGQHRRRDLREPQLGITILPGVCSDNASARNARAAVGAPSPTRPRPWGVCPGFG